MTKVIDFSLHKQKKEIEKQQDIYQLMTLITSAVMQISTLYVPKQPSKASVKIQINILGEVLINLEEGVE